MSEQWYKIIKDKEYCSSILDVFCGLHDYRITQIDIDYQCNTVVVNFRYDTDEEGVKLKFLRVTRLNVCPLKGNESPGLLGATILLTGNGNFLWYDNDEKHTEDEVFESKEMRWIEAKEIYFAWLDQNDNIIPLSEEKLNPTWSIMNWDAGKYEDIKKHFKVYKVKCRKGSR